MDYDYSSEESDENVRIIHCYCEGHCPFGDVQGICEIKSGGMCFTSVEAAVDDNGYEYPLLSYGCLPANEMALLQCQGSLVPHTESKSIQCCDEGDFCNKNLFPMYAVKENNYYSDKLPFILLMSSLGCSLVILFVVLAVVFMKYRRKELDNDKIQGNFPSELQECGMNNNKTVVNLREERITGNLSNLIDQSSGSGSGLPMMVQRTISKQLEMEKSVGKGRYGEVWLARWRGEKVAVKIFFTTEEKSWFRETEVYQTVLLRHDNILGFIGADIKGTGSWTQMLLITDFHEQGSLYDFLQEHSLSSKTLLIMSQSIARGIAHLHTEIFGVQGKPAIAHRDVKSKNILVKRNGECCVADFGLAVKFDSSTNEIDVPPTERSGTKRYMAPEILDKSINLNHFDSHKMTDIYAFGLVLWEMCRRCAIDGQPVADYAAPFHDYVPNDPSFDDMQKVVCDEKIRPEIPEFWNDDDVLKIMSKIMQEMWHDNPAVRLTALRVKKTLNRIRLD